MNNRIALTVLLLAVCPFPVTFAAPASTAPTQPAVDFGDGSSSTLTSKAWAALDAKRYDDVRVLAAKCQELYGAKAADMQRGLKDFAAEGKEHDYWALNDCGTCQFILAKSLDAQGKAKEAVAAYKVVAEKFGYAQCWDPQGWFWKPAEAAKQRVEELEAGGAAK